MVIVPSRVSLVGLGAMSKYKDSVCKARVVACVIQELASSLMVTERLTFVSTSKSNV